MIAAMSVHVSSFLQLEKLLAHGDYANYKGSSLSDHPIFLDATLCHDDDKYWTFRRLNTRLFPRFSAFPILPEIIITHQPFDPSTQFLRALSDGERQWG